MRRPAIFFWEYSHSLEQGAAPFVKRGSCCGATCFTSEPPTFMWSRPNARTGALVRGTGKIGDFKRVTSGLSGGPLVAEGVVMVGNQRGTGVSARFGGPGSRWWAWMR